MAPNDKSVSSLIILTYLLIEMAGGRPYAPITMPLHAKYTGCPTWGAPRVKNISARWKAWQASSQRSVVLRVDKTQEVALVAFTFILDDIVS